MSISVNVDIDIDDILWSMSSYEQEKLLEQLLDEMEPESIRKSVSKLKDERKKEIAVGLINTNKVTFCEEEFNNSLSKLSANYISLKKEDQEIIETIAKKY
jgi:hypothetical protein